jgi:hypothetical protein
MCADLIFRGTHQECAHNPKEISGFAAKLVFRDVPGKLVRRGGQTQRLRSSCASLTTSSIRIWHLPTSVSMAPRV